MLVLMVLSFPQTKGLSFLNKDFFFLNKEDLKSYRIFIDSQNHLGSLHLSGYDFGPTFNSFDPCRTKVGQKSNKNWMKCSKGKVE